MASMLTDTQTAPAEATPALAEERLRPRRRVRRRRGDLGSVLLPVLSLLVLVAAWELASVAFGSRDVPSPAQTFSRLGDLFSQGLVGKNLVPTLLRVLGGFAVALVVGVTIGTLMGLYKRGEQLLELGVMVALTIPSLCYIIVSFLWLGLTEKATILAIGLTSFPVIAVNVWSGVKAIDGRLIDMARVFGATPRERAFRVVLPQVLPYVMAAGRYGFGVVWKVAVFVELLGRSNGVGYQLNYSFQVFDMRSVFAWTLLFTLVMIVIELLVFKPIERRLFRWRPEFKA
jgi:NitT/TauT family transport system permease protein